MVLIGVPNHYIPFFNKRLPSISKKMQTILQKGTKLK